MLGKIEEAYRSERYTEARQLLAEGEAQAKDAVAHTEWLLWRSRLEQRSDELACDELILRMQALLESEEHGPEHRAQMYTIELESFLRKRLPGLALARLQRARSELGESERWSLLEASAALNDDDRLKALSVLEAAETQSAESPALLLALGHLYYVLGDFDAARQRLSAIGPESHEYGAAMRTLASIHGATGNREDEESCWRQLLEARKGGEHEQSDRISWALSLAALDKRTEALSAFQLAWQQSPDSYLGRYARERMTQLEAADDGAQRVVLRAFPSTAQKYEFCGPAVLELVLRYFDFQADQDAIAGVVKREHGTPMVEIVEYLRAMGVEARRFASNAERIKRAIDLGCPIIVQEEYSTCSHVAVITGYDDRLGVFVAQDPMRHAPMLKSFTFTDAAGQLFGNGAVVVLGPTELAAQRRQDCDEAGLIEQRHLALVDACGRQRQGFGEGAAEALSPQEVVQLCDEALSMAPQFRLAAFLRMQALMRLAWSNVLDNADLWRELARLRSRYPGEEWAHQLHAQVLEREGRYDEAFVAHFEAHRRDLYDENNLQAMGEACWLVGDLAEAERRMLAALAIGPNCIRAAENLAAVYLRMLEASDSQDDADEDLDDADEDQDLDDADEEQEDEDDADEDLDDADEDQDEEDEEDEEEDSETPRDREPSMPPKRLRSRLSWSRSELMRRARHFSEVAVSAHPGNPFNHVVSGELAKLQQRWADAVRSFDRALELDPYRGKARQSLVEVLEELGEVERAEALLEENLERSGHQAEAYLALAAFLHRCERDAEAAELLLSAVEAAEENREELVKPLFSALQKSASSEAAAARLRELAQVYLGDDDFLRAVVNTLDREGQKGHALALARLLTQKLPHDLGAKWQLARLLESTKQDVEEAQALYVQLMEAIPDSELIRVRLAWSLLGQEKAEQALAVLQPVLEVDDTDVLDAYSACLEALGREDEATALLERALQSAPTQSIGLMELIFRHIHGDRYERAQALASRLELAGLEADLGEDFIDARDDIEYAWLAAHRLSGKVLEVLPTLRERCAQSIPKHLAGEIYWSCRSTDFALASQAAEVYASKTDEEEERWEFRVRAAGLRARVSKECTELDELGQRLPSESGAWAMLSDAYNVMEQYPKAYEAAKRAFALDPNDGSAATAWIEALEQANRTDEALEVARAFAAARPYEHQGPERLGIILAKQGQVEEALAQSARAMDAAPYCHVSQQSRALAMLMSGEYEQALALARMAMGLEPPGPDDEGDSDAALILAALSGDEAALEKGLSALERKMPGVYPLYRQTLRGLVGVGVQSE
ncbi:MAG: C39 family peptidase [Myxococcota bacterium]|jgi:tetratricopeptide (TPR) repeat protein|nr:C39 family peptidase [Myxococcota bacterium]